MTDPTDSLLPTRSSLLSRLRHASDAASWQHFFDNYGRLIYQVCRRAGLNTQEADEVAQETIVSVSQELPKFKFDRSKGSFKGWLWRVTRNHVADFLKKKYRDGARRAELPEAGPGEAAPIARFADTREDLEAVWEEEWKSNLLDCALKRVRSQVSARSFQIFHLSTVKGWTVDQIKEALRTGTTQIYLARHRVGRLVKKEIAALRKDAE